MQENVLLCRKAAISLAKMQDPYILQDRSSRYFVQNRCMTPTIQLNMAYSRAAGSAQAGQAIA